MRIAIAGFQHETNTFNPFNAGIEEFRMADSWPGLLQGDAVVSDTRGMNIPIAGAIEAARGIELVPLLWCAAEPSGPVTDDAFEWVSAQIVDGLKAAPALDGIYLDLHGAMVTESHEDGEGELLKHLRDAMGYDLPIAVSLDFHANISASLVDLASLITIYRSYPHLDMAETGARCIRYLIEAIEGRGFYSAFRQIPFLIPLQAQYTGADPCRKIYRRVERLSADNDGFVEMAMGFTAADIRDCGPSVVAYAHSEQRARELADEIDAAVRASKADFDAALVDTSEAIEQALHSSASGPVVIADVQDNPGAGGTSDSTGIIAALIDRRARDTVVGIVCDSETARLAHDSGVGSLLSTALGAKSGIEGHSAIEANFRVLQLSDGEIAYTGEMYGGSMAELGPSCLLAVEQEGVDIQILVSSTRIQCLDRALFAHFGVELSRKKIICVKSTVHFRADFEPIAQKIINTESPGTFPCKLSLDQYQRLRPGVDCL